MLSTLRNAWKVPELRKRILFTVLMIAIYRMGNYIPVPGVDARKLSQLIGSQTMFGFYDLMSGGAFSRFSIFAMGVVPYINASIIMQLLTIAIPSLEQLSKEGQDGRKKIQKITRYASIPLAVLQAFSQYAIIRSAGGVQNASGLNVFLILLTLTTASTFLMWLGDMITEKGIGNGVSLLIFVNIISRIPSQIVQVTEPVKAGSINVIEIVMLLVLMTAIFISVVIASLAERRIPVQYAGKVVGNKTFKSQSTHIPINLNNSGVIAIIFAMAVMEFPKIIGQFFRDSAFNKFITGSKYSVFRNDSWQYALVYFILIVFFTWFYTQVTFKPDEMSENMHKSSGFIPGIRPGEPTAIYIEKVLDRVSIIGGTFAALIAIFPILLQTYSQLKGIYFGGTSLLIEVGVALEWMKQLQSQLVMRHYQGFLK